MQEQQLQLQEIRESIKKMESELKKIKAAHTKACKKNDTVLMDALSEKYKELAKQINVIGAVHNKLNDEIIQHRKTSCPNLSKLSVIIESHKDNYSRIHKSITNIINDLRKKEFDRLIKQDERVNPFDVNRVVAEIGKQFEILLKNRGDILNEYVNTYNTNFKASTNPDLDVEDIKNILHTHYRLLLDFSTSLAIQYNVMPTLNGLVFDKDVDNAFTEKEKDFFRSL